MLTGCCHCKGGVKKEPSVSEIPFSEIMPSYDYSMPSDGGTVGPPLPSICGVCNSFPLRWTFEIDEARIQLDPVDERFNPCLQTGGKKTLYYSGNQVSPGGPGQGFAFPVGQFCASWRSNEKAWYADKYECNNENPPVLSEVCRINGISKPQWELLAWGDDNFGGSWTRFALLFYWTGCGGPSVGYQEQVGSLQMGFYIESPPSSIPCFGPYTSITNQFGGFLGIFLQRFYDTGNTPITIFPG